MRANNTWINGAIKYEYVNPYTLKPSEVKLPEAVDKSEKTRFKRFHN